MGVRESDKGKNLECPLLKLQEKLSSKCLEENCAWWDKNSERCSIKVIAQNLYKEIA